MCFNQGPGLTPLASSAVGEAVGVSPTPAPGCAGSTAGLRAALSPSPGDHLTLDGQEALQETSPKEEAASLPSPPATGLPAVACTPQPPSPLDALSEAQVSPFTPDSPARQPWVAVEDPCSETQSPPPAADPRRQIMACIRRIEAALEHLQVPRARSPGARHRARCPWGVQRARRGSEPGSFL